MLKEDTNCQPLLYLRTLVPVCTVVRTLVQVVQCTALARGRRDLP